MMVGPSKAGMIYYTLPLFSGFLAYLFLKEDISIIHFYSVFLIVSGILTANYEFKNLRNWFNERGLIFILLSIAVLGPSVVSWFALEVEFWRELRARNQRFAEYERMRQECP